MPISTRDWPICGIAVDRSAAKRDHEAMKASVQPLPGTLGDQVACKTLFGDFFTRIHQSRSCL
jgi:hypothetical protein